MNAKCDLFLIAASLSFEVLLKFVCYSTCSLRHHQTKAKAATRTLSDIVNVENHAEHKAKDSGYKAVKITLMSCSPLL